MTGRGVGKMGGDKAREAGQKLGKRARTLAGVGALYGAQKVGRGLDSRLEERTRRRARRRVARSRAGYVAGALGSSLPPGSRLEDLQETAAEAASSERQARKERFSPMRAVDAARALGYALDTRPEFRKQQRLERAQQNVANRTPLQAIGGGRAEYYQQIRDKNFREQVERSTSGLQARIPAGDLDGLRAALTRAIQSGNAVEARAAQEILLNSGGGGIERVRQSFEEAGQAAIAGNPELARRMQEGINANWSQVKQRVPDLAGWSPDREGTVSYLKRQPDGTMRPITLTDEQVSNMHRNALDRAISTGALSKVQAARVLANDNLAGNIDAERRARLEGHT